MPLGNLCRSERHHRCCIAEAESEESKDRAQSLEEWEDAMGWYLQEERFAMCSHLILKVVLELLLDTRMNCRG